MPAGQFFTRRPLAVAGSVAILAAGITAVASLGADRSSKAGAQGGPGAFPSVAVVAAGLAKNGAIASASPRFEITVFGVSIQSEPDPGTDAAVEFGDDRPDPSSPDANHTYKGHNAKVRVGDIGAVWGLAYAGGDPTAASADGRGPRSFYASYAKSMTRFGPLGPGGIYVRIGSVTKPYVTIPNTVSATGDITDTLGGIHSTSGLDGITQVGKVSLGDIEIDSNEKLLYVTNLGNRRVYSVDTRSADPQSTVTAVPAAPNPCAAATDYRPFGLKVVGSTLLLASTCSGETAATDLSADVYAFDTALSTWSATPAMHADLAAAGTVAPWADSHVPNESPVTAMMFTGIDLTADGDLVVGMRGRYADLVVTTDPYLFPVSNGMVTIAKRTGAVTWQSFLLTDPTPSKTAAGGAPYFVSDSLDKGSLNPQGAVAVVPRTRAGAPGSEIVTTQRDVFNLDSQGVSFFDQAAGDYAAGKKTTSREEIYRGKVAPFWGKASGIGDLELLATWRSFGNLVWNDANGNGMQDTGENGVAGVTLSLKATCGASSSLASVRTDGNGGYTFYVDPFRAYVVEVDTSNFSSGSPLSGRELTPSNVGDDTVDSDADTTTRCVSVAAAGREDTNVTYDVGVRTPAPLLYAVGDKVWIDADKNGVQDATELPLKGITVDLVGTGKTTTTNDAGMYVFDALPAGAYEVKFSGLPTGHTFTTKGSGAATTDSNATASGASGSFTVGPVGAALPNMSSVVPAGINASAIDATIDAGVIAPDVLYGVGDEVWIDANGNDRRDAGELPADKLAVTLVQNGADVATTATTATGTYSFDGLAAGTYQVRFAVPTGYVFVNKGDGSSATDDSNAAAAGATIGLTDVFTLGPVGTVLPNMSATVPAGMKAVAFDPTIDAGIRIRPPNPVFAVGDTVWLDRNHNGRQDSGEPGLADVAVELGSSTGATKATKTDANGTYLFDGLPAGSYTVVVVAPAAYRFTNALVGDAAGNSDVDANTGVTAVFELGAAAPNMSTKVPAGSAAAAINSTIDAGLWQPLAIGDRVWRDANSNGKQDEGEPAVPSLRVELLDETNAPVSNARGSVVVPAITDANGHYSFDNLLPGTYHVKFTGIPAGDVLTLASATGVAIGENSDADVTTGIAVVVLDGTNPNLTAIEPNDGVAIAVLIDRTIDAGISHPTHSLGNRVWFDQNGDGKAQLAEPGIDGVIVSLFSVSDAGSIELPALVTTVTSAGGYYRFDNLTVGHYIVQVEGANFAPAGMLHRFASVSNDEINPDTDVDLNDNGIGVGSGPDAVSSGLITIADNEPTEEADLGVGGQGAPDNRANMTVDFAFTTGYNLAFDKALISAELSKGLTAKYRLTVTNTSPVPAEGVVVTDTLPDTLKLRNAAGAGFDCSSVGQVTTCRRTSPIDAGATVSIDLDAEVLSATGDVVNVADVKSPRDAEDPPVDNKDKVTAQVLTKVLPRTGSSGTGSTMRWALGLAAFGIALVIADRRTRTRTAR
jgi:uncharacterized repeat protein (TIGR01451 family)